MDLGTIFESHEVDELSGGDVTREAVERGWIQEFAVGQYVYRRPWVKLLRMLQNRILQSAEDLGFEECLFPRLIPREALDSFRLSQYAPELLIQAGVDSRQVLDPVQCISLYHLLRGQEVDVRQGPIRIVETLGGWTWRNEREHELDGPIKAREFLRVEHVFLGKREDVRKTRREVREGLTKLLSEWGLAWQVVAAEGCMEIPSLVEMQDGAVSSDEVPVQDIEVPLSSVRAGGSRPPWATHFDDRYDLREISGCSAEGDHLTSSFNIRTTTGEALWSGCCGIGLNRLAVAYLYRHGFEVAENASFNPRVAC